MRMCFAEDDTPFSVADLIAELRRRAVYDDGSAGEWETVSAQDVSLEDVSAQEIFADADAPVFSGGASAIVKYQLPDGSEMSQTVTVGNFTISRRGDLNADGIVNANDASELLIYAAAVGGGKPAELTDIAAFVGDTDQDGAVNAADAANILIYAAIAGSNGAADWKEILDLS